MSFTSDAGTSLLIVQGLDLEDIKAFHDFCEAASDKFHVRAWVAQFCNQEDIDWVSDWVNHANDVIKTLDV